MKTLDDKIEDALKWAREAAETQRGSCDAAGEDALVPSWLPELETALKEIEAHEETEEEYLEAVGAHEARKDYRSSRLRAARSTKEGGV